MKKRYGWILALMAISVSWAFQDSDRKAAEAVEVSALLKSSDKYHRTMVQVTGEVQDFKKKTSKANNPYTTFNLEDKSGVIHVYVMGHVDKIKDGDKVKVTGKFFKERRVGSANFKNEIDASSKEGGKIEKNE